MDIFYFFNSRDVAEHLKKINYNFSLTEKCFVIAMSQKATLNEKKQAFKHIMATEQDQPLPPRRFFKGSSSFFDSLQQYIDAHDKMVQTFFDEPNSVYTLRYLCKGDQSYCEDFGTVYPSFDACKKSFDQQIERFEMKDDVICYEIKMQSLADTDKSVHLVFRPDGEIVDVYGYKIFDNEDDDVLLMFEDMWIPFPLPFKRGDIITRKRYYSFAKQNDTLVFASSLTWSTDDYIAGGYHPQDHEFYDGDKARARLLKSGDASDMTVVGYFCSEDGTIYREVEWNMLDYEYNRKPLEKGFRNLKVVSEFEKGQIGLDDLLKLHELVKDEFKAKDDRKYIHLFDDYLKKIGID